MLNGKFWESYHYEPIQWHKDLLPGISLGVSPGTERGWIERPGASRPTHIPKWRDQEQHPFLVTTLRLSLRFSWTSDTLLLKEKFSFLRIFWAVGRARKFKSRLRRFFLAVLKTCWGKTRSVFFFHVEEIVPACMVSYEMFRGLCNVWVIIC